MTARGVFLFALAAQIGQILFAEFFVADILIEGGNGFLKLLVKISKNHDH
ncbi:MAG: hypothetical protein IJZ37_03495 [Clostridia bacterium]|nr:hypothetical protein [Clostridia bacterium]